MMEEGIMLSTTDLIAVNVPIIHLSGEVMIMLGSRKIIIAITTIIAGE
jgi:hypothetical protein